MQILKYRNQHLMQCMLHPGIIIMADSVWHVDRAWILNNNRDFHIKNFKIHHKDQAISLQGKISDFIQDTLSMTLNHFDLASVSQLLWGNRSRVFGQIDGKIHVNDFYNSQRIFMNVNIGNCGINSDTLGSIKFLSFWDLPQNRIKMQIIDQIGDKKPFLFTGTYEPTTDSLDIILNLNRIDI